MANWTTTIMPQTLLIDGYSETYADNIIRSNMEVGPAKQRQRISAAVTPITGSLILTSSEATAFDTFYNTTINHGADQFEWTHPRTGSTCQMRFTAVPRLERVESYWRLSMQLEILP